MTAFTSINPVYVGKPTRVSDFDTLWNNTLHLKEELDDNFLYGAKASDQTLTSQAALQNCTDLVFAVGALETWTFRFVMRGRSHTTPDWQWAVTFPTAPTSVMYGVLSASQAVTAQAAAAGGTALMTNGLNADELIVVDGVIVNGANAGNVQLQFCQNTSNVNGTTIYRGSFFEARRMA